MSSLCLTEKYEGLQIVAVELNHLVFEVDLAQ